MFEPPKLNLPPYDVELRRDDDSLRGGLEIYDKLRRRWIALTPEEWVRQHFVHYLSDTMAFPANFMANEVGLTLNGTRRRCDTLVYTPWLAPLAVIEYKSADIALTQRVFDQIARYNTVVGAPFLIVSNGLKHYCCRYSGEAYGFLRDIPPYTAMVEYYKNVFRKE